MVDATFKNLIIFWVSLYPSPVKVIELLGRDNVNLNPKQVKQIIELIGQWKQQLLIGRTSFFNLYWMLSVIK